MIYFNADGSLAEMCGNGIRCFAKWVFDHGLTATTHDLRIMTGAGIKNIQIDVASGKASTIRVDMGPPQFEAAAIPVIGKQDTLSISLPFPGFELEGAAVSMGNPHCVLFIDSDPNEMDVGTIGPAIENNTTVFPEKTNVQFVKVIDRNNVKARIWERGVGETLASGTSSCAIVAAGVKRGLLDPVCIVHLPGGELSIDWQESTSIFMTGAAEEVFSGTIEL